MLFSEVLPTISYDDVLLVPYHSDMKSRSEGNPTTHWGHSLPIIMSPMNTVCSGKMMKLFVDQNMIATIHRYFMSAEAQLDYVKKQIKLACFEDVKKECSDVSENVESVISDDVINQYIDKIYFAVGSVVKYKEWIDYLRNNGVTNFLVDMAHGDTMACEETVKYIRSFGDRSHIKIIAGNVATRGGYRRLRDAGADGIRVGIGGGCFIPGSQVWTPDGYKNIENIKIGDLVYTHDGSPQKVEDVLTFDFDGELYNINGNKSTPNHEYYVIKSVSYKALIKNEKIDVTTIAEKAEWVSADKLTLNKYMLITVDVHGDHIKYGCQPIKSITTEKYKGSVYDLTVENNHSYNIQKYIVHNSICSTRTSTGFGVPTLTSIIDCNDVKGDTFMIADGGIKTSGDIVKAIRFGADYVMCGKLLAGTEYACGELYNNKEEIITNTPIIHDKDISQYKKILHLLQTNPQYIIDLCEQCPRTEENIIPEVIHSLFVENPVTIPLIDDKDEDDQNYVLEIKKNHLLNLINNYLNEHLVTMRGYCGMASREARGSVLSYSSVEGKAGLIKYTGSTVQLLIDIKLNLQAALSYGGSRNWSEFRQNVKCIKVTQSGIDESNTHLDKNFS